MKNKVVKAGFLLTLSILICAFMGLNLPGVGPALNPRAPSPGTVGDSGIAESPDGRSSRIYTSWEVPAGLSAQDWQDIRGQISRNRYRMQASESQSFQADNPAQEWRSFFRAGETKVRPADGSFAWGLKLAEYGGRPVGRAPLKTWTDGDRVYNRWDGNLVEWIRNEDRGLKQTFEIRRRPLATRPGRPLMLALEVTGGLKARVDTGLQQISFQDPGSRTKLTYGELVVYDANGSRLPARFEAGGGRLGIAVDDRQAVYPVTVDPLVQQAYLKASNTDAGDGFGYSVAISGETIVVGAPGEASSAEGVNGNQNDNSALASGAAYVFVRNGTAWAQQAYLKASNATTGDYFGFSVAISGDTLVVGAPYESSNATGVNGNQNDNSAWQAGAAYVFVRDGTTWTRQAYLKASNTDGGDEFGASVAISGNTIVVGARNESSSATGVNGTQSDNSASWSGAAYVFVRNMFVFPVTWAQQAYLKASNTDSGDLFGMSVAISGNTIVVGAPYESSKATGVNGNQSDNSASGSGAAYVFVRNVFAFPVTWAQQDYLKASNTGNGDLFGASVAISGDTIVVGAPYESSSANGVNGDQNDNLTLLSGAAYAFVRNGANWTQQAYLKASNTGAGDRFGFRVAISEDTVIVGALFEDGSANGVNGTDNNHATDSGAAYVFQRIKSLLIFPKWTQTAYLKASNTDGGDCFGISVAISGETVVAGAVNESSTAAGVNGNQGDNSAASAGAAYVFSPPSLLYLPLVIRQ
jgi:hypothetical protein